MTSRQLPAKAADESQQNNAQADDDYFEQIEAPVTFKVSSLACIARLSLTINA
jgi:hypothetical protein